ncbi:MAG: cytochrome P450 [Trebouxia sp. A1-2]|nr:MAG: cytochrome P450 [Trebouxia sp. A1-2]
MSTVGSVAIVFTSVLSVVAAWLLWTRAQRRLRYDLKDIPGPKQQPLIGNLRSVLGSSYLHKVLARWTAHYGPIYKWNLSGMDVLVITDPHEVFKLSSRELNLPKASFFYKGVNTRAPHNNILATPDYEEWKYFRRMTNFAFSPDNIRKDSKQFQSDLSLTFTNPMYALLLVLCPWLERAKQRKATAKCLADKDDELAAIIQKRGVQPESNTSLWACLSRFVSYKDGGPIPVQTLAANAGIFFAAGVQEELREAGLAASPGSPPPRSLDYADLSKLKMLDAIAKEALRLHATAPIGSVRQAQTKPHTVSSYPDATPTGNRRSINGSWNPFSSGPRNCIGQALAMAELRTVLAVFLGNFSFQLPEGVQREKFIEEEEVAWVTLQAKHGMHLRVRSIMGMQKKEYGMSPEE